MREILAPELMMQQMSSGNSGAVVASKELSKVNRKVCSQLFPEAEHISDAVKVRACFGVTVESGGYASLCDN